MTSIYDLKPKFQDLLRPISNRLAAAGINANQVAVSALLLPFSGDPCHLHGLGKALPKGPYPLFCDVFVDEPLGWAGNREGYMTQLENTFQKPAGVGHFSLWE